MGELLYGEAIHIRKQAEIDAARITQKSGNARRGAETALAQFSSSLANRRAMDAAGTNYNTSSENVSRALDATARGTFSQRIAAAEELGASLAMAGAAGVGGSSVEAYNATLRLHNAMNEEAQDRTTRSQVIGAGRQAGEYIEDATAGLDSNVYRANLDFTQYVDHRKMGTFERLGWIGAAAAAAYVGGPQAGSAIVGIAEGKQAASNGDFATASRSMMGALNDGFSAGQSIAKHRKAPAAKAAATPTYSINFDQASFGQKYGFGVNYKG